VTFPLASAALAAGALAQVSAPAAFLTAACAACPCAHIQTAVQVVGALTALPAAAAAALGSAARVGPARLASATYTRLASALVAWAVVTGAGIALASPRLALAPWFKASAGVGLTGLAAAAAVAAAYAPGGVGAAARALPATLAGAATLPPDAPPLARAHGGLATAAALGAAALGVTALSAAAAPVPPPVRVLLAFSATAAALASSLVMGVLADAAARGRAGASTFITLARGGLVAGGLATGALAGLVRGSAGKAVAGGTVPVVGFIAWVVGVVAVCGWHVVLRGEGGG